MKDILKLIQFINGLVDEVFGDYIDDIPAEYYFKNGGCLEFASILHHYIPNSFFVLNQIDQDHIALKIEDAVYDCEGVHDPKDYLVLTLEEVKNYQECYGRGILFEQKPVNVAVIDELNSCSGDYVKKLVQSTTKEGSYVKKS